jgi:hypothetical protein
VKIIVEGQAASDHLTMCWQRALRDGTLDGFAGLLNGLSEDRGPGVAVRVFPPEAAGNGGSEVAVRSRVVDPGAEWLPHYTWDARLFYGVKDGCQGWHMEYTNVGSEERGRRWE